MNYNKFLMNGEVLFKIFEKAMEKRKSVLLIGKFGIGKSSVIYKYAEKKAKELNKQLAIWHELTEKEKYEIINNADKYFVLVDIKGSMISLENLIMPVLDKNNQLVWQVPLWVKVFEKENSSGILFIDEINMTSSKLQSILFELILQRKIAETSLKSKNLLIIAGGNDLDSNEYANEIPKPLINRFILVNADEYLLNIDYWVAWAKRNNIDDRIIHYVLFKNKLFTKSEDSLSQSTTPRSLEILSEMIKDENDINMIEVFAKTLLEKNDAIEFTAFVKLYEKLKDINIYIKDVNKLEELKEDELFIVTMKIVDYYLSNKINVNDLMKVLNKLLELRKEYIVVALKLIKISDMNKFDELTDKIVENDNELYRMLKDMLTFYK